MVATECRAARSRALTRRRRYAPALALLAVLSGGCSTTGGVAPRDPTDTISSETIRELVSTAPDAYGIVNRVRPQWLRGRGVVSIQEPESRFPPVYHGSRYGTIEQLGSISSQTVELIQYLSAPEATTRFGTGHPGGVILVSTRTGG